MTFVEHGYQVDASGYESRFKEADEDAACNQAPEGACDALSDGEDPACPDDETEEHRGSDFLEDHVAWDFEEDVGNEENKEGDVVVASGHVEICLEPLNPGIADVDTIARLIWRRGCHWALRDVPVNKGAE